MKPILQNIFLVAAVSGVVLFTNLGGVRLWDRDEPRNAGCAEEMMKRGNWVTPIFNDELRSQKPVLLYWFMISAYSVFGFNEFGARFWSAALSVGTVICTYLIGRRLFNPSAGIWAAIALTTSMMFVVAGRAATPDAPLIFFSTLALTLFVYQVFGKQSEVVDASTTDEVTKVDRRFFPPTWIGCVAMYSAMGFAVLAKGPIGIVMPTAIIGMFLLVARLRPEENHNNFWIVNRAVSLVRPFSPIHFLKKCWSMRPLSAIGVVLLIAAPWYLAVGIQTEGDFLREFFFKEHFGRATPAMENHNGSIFFYPMTILVGFFPWSIFAVPVMIFVVRQLKSKDNNISKQIVFVLCWIGVVVGIFTIAKTKLPSYITPCYPALALLTGCFIDAWCRRESRVARFWTLGSKVCLSIVGLAICIGLPIVTSKFLPQEKWLWLVGLIPMIGAIGMFGFERKGNRAAAMDFLGITAILFVLALFAFGTDRVDKYRETDLFAHVPSDGSAQIATFGCLESSWVYYAKQPIFELREGFPHKVANHTFEETQNVRKKNWKDKPQPRAHNFFESNSNPYIVTLRSKLPNLKELVGTDFQIVCEKKYFLKDEYLVLIRKIDRQMIAKRPAENRQAAEKSRDGLSTDIR